MSDTLAVIALDAADLELARQWECTNMLLEQDAPIESLAGTRDVPLTTEVWPSVATGLPPDEHGIVAEGNQQEWSNPLMRRLGGAVPAFVPSLLRIRAGEWLRRMIDPDGVGMTLNQTEASHPFERGGTYGWPGIDDATHLLEAWRWLELAKAGDLSERDLLERVYANTGEELGWLLAMSDRGFPTLGVHVHILDVLGHLYAARETELERSYRRVDELLGVIRDQVERLLVISDHGMQVSWLGDETPGDHSWRAMVASTEDGSLPETVLDVRGWIEQRRGPDERHDDSGFRIDTSEEQLRHLGYIE